MGRVSGVHIVSSSQISVSELISLSSFAAVLSNSCLIMVLAQLHAAECGVGVNSLLIIRTHSFRPRNQRTENLFVCVP